MFLNLKACNFIKKRLYEICEIITPMPKNTYFEDLWKTVSVVRTCGNSPTGDTNNSQKQPPEVFFEKNLFLEISQNSQENTCARISFLNKKAGLSLQFY